MSIELADTELGLVLRREPLDLVLSALRHRHYVAICGPPASGTTTFVRQVVQAMGARRDMADYVPVVVSHEELQQGFVRTVVAQLAAAVGHEVSTAQLSQWLRTSGHRALVKRALGDQHRRVVLFFDNFHALPDEAQQQVTSDARRLYEELRDFPLAPLIVISGAIRWGRIDPERASPFWNAVSRIELRDLSLEEIVSIARMRLPFMLNRYLPVLRTLHDYTSGHPYLTQRLCDLMKRDRRSEELSVVDKVHELIAGGDSHLWRLRQRVAGLSDEQLAPLGKLMAGEAIYHKEFDSDPALEELLVLGVLTRCVGGRLAFRNRIYARCLRADTALLERLKQQAAVAPAELVCHRGNHLTREAYFIINCIANELRTCIGMMLFRVYGERWPELALAAVEVREPSGAMGLEASAEAGVKPQTLLGALERRRDVARKQPAQDRDRPEPLLLYATLAELKQLIVCEQHWPFFRKLHQEMSRAELNKSFEALLTLQQRVAHHRPVTQQGLFHIRSIRSQLRTWQLLFGDAGAM